MNLNCDFIQDLLPIYTENIASESTRQIVEDHLCSCAQCKNVLEDVKKEIELPLDTDVQPLKDLGIGFRRKSVLTVVCSVLALLIALHCVLILATVPVWLSEEEAIVEIVGVETVETMDPPRNKLVFVTASNVLRLHQSGSGIWCEGYRISALDKEPVRGGILLRSDIQESYFYRGYFAGEDNSLLHGSADAELASMPQEPGADADLTLQYLFYGTLAAGALCLLIGLIFSRQLGKGVAWIGVFLLAVALTTCFVTGGHFALRQDPMDPQTLHGEMLFRMGHILISTLLVWGFCIALWYRVSLWLREKRRVTHES